MPSAPDLLTASEAAAVASVSLRDVNRVIDEGLLPARFYSLEGGRKLRTEACPLVGFYFHGADSLTAAERGRLIRKLSDRISPQARGPAARSGKSARPDDWTISDGFLTVNLWEFVVGTEAQLSKLAAAREAVVEDPEILSGEPVIRGTRIRVYDVAASVAAGVPRNRLRAAYPTLDDRTIDLAALYAAATPQRGRPRRASGAVIASVVARRLPRRRKE